MTADRLREAARVLRERAEAATVDCPQPWVVEDDNHAPYTTVIDECGWRVTEGPDQFYRHVAEYIATMHPGVGLALADWLDDTAASHDFSQALDPFGRVYIEKATAVADLILGTTS